ncbi:hypothetical protein BABINDRAFT_40958 [Babjeviella inositovora NRRL Y-12698]|uniref:Protein-lysine N-methyltransferase EFM5 n=1 Tax=Babjeviella inositovora NRRL Y-12698 TaxID=984486 RepID=A0A1E3QJ37_9ASCO|nr:uncharacterized protein BABINDRAFT_40958 [Babjeviella inositovora NRRL Y-12698]ODQ77733.1 hypothetical protein BABINDRAFT_40958 [Babjeviella inositovora NRRL Y-12698]
MSDTDDEPITLSPYALQALLQFKEEEEERIAQLAKLQEVVATDVVEDKSILSIDTFKEDWNLSQFWYAEDTANLLADELLDGADADTVICIVSAPSVYSAIKQRDVVLPTKHIYLFEYDKRFELLAGKEHFGFYDYVEPFAYRHDLKGKVHRLLIDPPFLSDECQSKVALTAKSLLVEDKTVVNSLGELQYKLISSTGEVMAPVIRKAYPGVNMTDFVPQHKNGLSNLFACYASYEGKSWKFRDELYYTH